MPLSNLPVKASTGTTAVYPASCSVHSFEKLCSFLFLTLTIDIPFLRLSNVSCNACVALTMKFQTSEIASNSSHNCFRNIVPEIVVLGLLCCLQKAPYFEAILDDIHICALDSPSDLCRYGKLNSMLGQVIDMVFDVFERFGDFIKEFDETQSDQFIPFQKA